MNFKESFFQMTVDHEEGVCYIKITDEDIVHSKKIADCLWFDYDRQNNIIGIEILQDVEICDITNYNKISNEDRYEN